MRLMAPATGADVADDGRKKVTADHAPIKVITVPVHIISNPPAHPVMAPIPINTISPPMIKAMMLPTKSVN